MASAQVLPNSVASTRKKDLEAGKRRLEEFRKKKAADRAKKAAPARHLHTANVDLHDKEPLDNQHVRLTDSSGAGMSAGISETVVEPSQAVIGDENKEKMFLQSNDLGSDDKYAKPSLPTNYHNIAQAHAKDQELDSYNGLHHAGSVNVNYIPQPQGKNDDFSISSGASGRHAYGIATSTDKSVAFGSQGIWEIDRDTSRPSPYGLEEAHSKDNDNHMKDFTVISTDSSHAIVSNLSPEISGSFLLQNNFGFTSPQAGGLMSATYEDYIHPPIKNTESSFEVEKNMHAIPEFNNTVPYNMTERKLGNPVGRFPSGNRTLLSPSESRPTAFSFGVGGTSDHVPSYLAVSEPNTRRSRPSFLDSINMPKELPTDPGRVELFSSKVHDVDIVRSSASQALFTETETSQPFSNFRASNVPTALEHSMTAVAAGNGDDLYRHTVKDTSVERKHDSYSRKVDDDFAALEQHIEDLTQEKFSLQRDLEASRALADSLAAENSALTDSYNQQGIAVNQLKFDMEKLQEEIKAQLVELESLKMEYANAHLECNAADERAKLLASEVIGLEEKALRLRSNELKLERQLENSQAEVSSCKRKMSSAEKEHQDLHATVNALLEEKKLLQAMLRRASSNGKSSAVSKSLSNKKDVSTSTEDLVHEDDTDTIAENSNLQMMHSTASILRSDASSSFLFPENRQFGLEVSYSNIPPDQTRMIESINTLISELAMEKEELVKGLLAESSESSKLKELNKELSRKLEAQTQRLELLTAQSMKNANIPTRPPDPRSLEDNTPFADEGDEVVERVLGWIMKLFPGGPSRRQPSKLL